MQIAQKSIRIIDYEQQHILIRETPEAFDAYVAELTLSQFSRHSKHRVIFVFHTNAWNFSSCQFFESQWSGSGIAIQKIAAAAV